MWSKRDSSWSKRNSRGPCYYSSGIVLVVVWPSQVFAVEGAIRAISLL